MEKLISKNYFLNLSAKEAYKAYVRAYESHSLKHIYDVQNLGKQTYNIDWVILSLLSKKTSLSTIQYCTVYTSTVNCVGQYLYIQYG